MPVEESKEKELADQVSELKGKLSNAENANGSLSRDLAAARKAQETAEQAAGEAKALKQKVSDLEADLSRARADVSSANAKAERADRIIEDARGLKRLIDAA